MPKLESGLPNSATDRGNHGGVASTFTPYIEAVRKSCQSEMLNICQIWDSSSGAGIRSPRSNMDT